MQRYESLPPQFYLQDLAAITGRVCELRVNPYQADADRAARSWFNQISVYDDRKKSKFLNYGKFDLFAALSFPDADSAHLETCIMFFFWAFSTDDLSDEGDLQSKPDAVQAGHDISVSVYTNPDGSRPKYPYAAMLYDLLTRFRGTSTIGAYNRFIKAFEAWSSSQVSQSRNRSQDRMPSVEEFILMRRATIGGALVEAMIEYSLDLDLPDVVFENPIIKAMSDATTDLMTWPNDLCSFNKEQADGDYQNLVFCIMHERDVGLQEAINILTEMLNQRVDDYVNLKSQLPSFGADVDAELEIYLHALENFTQGTVMWYYLSPRYFRGVDVTNREDLVVPLFEKGAF
ncbi:terpenoid synthase [Suillus fuscotomentosus]|uniref:Terpene synthase n=1 Tax=Suillus fuscotomentosus TaxID=1912939 RepID=A0AAD4E380_9AGAM|nr:terpenoid synthase [Suillus fuscotomentosus]KAG1898866.1 terpenoid synthase [Suillus fuscotomentosus]